MPLAALLALLLTPVPALECTPPPTPLCQLLIPNLVIFIGKPIARVPLPKSGVLVTFEVQELFWGPTGQRTLKLGFGQYGNPSAAPEFFAVLPRSDGRYHYLPGFCHNLHFPVSHPFVTEYRRLAAERAPVRLRIRATSNRAPVADTEFQLSGNGLPFRGRMNGDAPYRIPALRPGTYKLSAKRPNFTQAQPDEELSIPPATCAEVDIRMTSASRVRGVARDARGNPLRKPTR